MMSENLRKEIAKVNFKSLEASLPRNYLNNKEEQNKNPNESKAKISKFKHPQLIRDL